MQPLGQRDGQLRVAGKNFRLQGRQRDVVVGQRDAGLAGEKLFGGLIELGIDWMGLLRSCHA